MSIKQHITNEQAWLFDDGFGSGGRGCASVEQLIREADIDSERGTEGTPLARCVLYRDDIAVRLDKSRDHGQTEATSGESENLINQLSDITNTIRGSSIKITHLFGINCRAASFFVLAFIIYPFQVFSHEYPELNPPKVERSLPDQPREVLISPLGTPTTEWLFHKNADGSHPDGSEQQFMWLINRARSNPSEEGIRLATMGDPDVAGACAYYGVNFDLLKSEFDVISIKPPAVFDIRLYNAAKSHSDYLIAIDGQDHNSQFTRIDTAGFQWNSCRGNVFSYTKNAIHGNAGFNIDWGYSIDGSGMQYDRGHRKAVMSIDGDYTNVGIAAVPENNPDTAVGPLVVTGNYCNANTRYADHYNLFIVGTVWTDKDNDGLYDPGEGVGGVMVTPSMGTYFAITGHNGGYAIPLIAGGSYQVAFTGEGVPDGTVRSVSVVDQSVLLDLEMNSVLDSDGDEPVKNRAKSIPSILKLLL
jgi:hypothetical protein